MTEENIPGVIYSQAFAKMLGLDTKESTDLIDPMLLGVGISISKGRSTTGNTCSLHLFINSNADIKLPTENSIQNPVVNWSELPINLVTKPNKILKDFFGQRVRKLSNLAIIRFSTQELKQKTKIQTDPNGTYSSFPLIQYNKEVFPGVLHIEMSLICIPESLKANKKASMFFMKKTTHDKDFIQSNHIDPDKTTEIKIPYIIFIGMMNDFEQAMKEDNTAKKIKRRLFKSFK
jgi:hypothetical protein